jgi:hypothetical protein
MLCKTRFTQSNNHKHVVDVFHIVILPTITIISFFRTPHTQHGMHEQHR